MKTLQKHEKENCCAVRDARSGDKVGVDSVCGMKMNPEGSASYNYAGRTYYFCSAHCHHKFESSPQKYVETPESTPKSKTDSEILYTCPMHPEVRQKGPGNCPLCGMALEPLAPSLEGESNGELVKMSRRLKIGTAFTLPLLILTMGEMIPGVELYQWLSIAPWNWIQFLLATPVVLWIGAPLFERGYQSFRTGRLNMFSLIALGITDTA